MKVRSNIRKAMIMILAIAIIFSYTIPNSIVKVYADTPVTVTIDANGGAFPDGTTSKTYEVGSNVLRDNGDGTYEYDLNYAASECNATKEGFRNTGYIDESGNFIFHPRNTITTSITVYIKWVVESGTITLNANGGVFSDGSDTKAIDVNIDNTGNISSDFTTFEVPTYTVPGKGDLEFVGWSRNQNEQWEAPMSGVMSGNIGCTYEEGIVYYAIWKCQRVTFVVNGTNVSQQMYVSYITTLADIKPADPEKENHTFIGWSAITFPTYNIIQDSDTLDPDIYNLYAIFSENSSGGSTSDDYRVSFNTFGGSEIADQIVSSGGLAIRPEDPIKNEYIFMNWFYNGSVFNFNTPILTDMTLFANWLDKKTITLNANGGLFSSNSQSTKQQDVGVDGSTYICSNVGSWEIPEREGYSFKGWSVNDNSSTGVTVGNPGIQYSDNIVIYAVWQESVHTVTYKLYNDGSTFPDGTTEDKIKRYEFFIQSSNGVVRQADIPYTDMTTLIPIREGYIFCGWTTTYGSNHGDIYSDSRRYDSSNNGMGSGYTSHTGTNFWMNYNINYNNPNRKVFSIYDSVVVYPVWTSSMIFDAGEGEFVGGGNTKYATHDMLYNTYTSTEDQQFSVWQDKCPVPTRENYTFMGWSNQQNTGGNNLFALTNNHIVSADVVASQGQKRVYAVWTANSTTPTNPEPSNPEPSNPEPSNPEPSNPEPSNPEPSNPEPSNPEPSNPEPSNPEPSNPEPSNPEPSDPTPNDPEPTEPEPTEPEPTEPEPSNPEPSDPEPTETESTTESDPEPGAISDPISQPTPENEQISEPEPTEPINPEPTEPNPISTLFLGLETTPEPRPIPEIVDDTVIEDDTQPEIVINEIIPEEDPEPIYVGDNDSDKDTKATAFGRFVEAVKSVVVVVAISLGAVFGLVGLLILILLWMKRVKVYNDNNTDEYGEKKYKVIYKTVIKTEGSIVSELSRQKDRVWTIVIPDEVINERTTDTFKVELKKIFCKRYNGEQLVIKIGSRNNVQQTGYVIDEQETTIEFMIAEV